MMENVHKQLGNHMFEIGSVGDIFFMNMVAYPDPDTFGRDILEGLVESGIETTVIDSSENGRTETGTLVHSGASNDGGLSTEYALVAGRWRCFFTLDMVAKIGLRFQQGSSQSAVITLSAYSDLF